MVPTSCDAFIRPSSPSKAVSTLYPALSRLRLATPRSASSSSTTRIVSVPLVCPGTVTGLVCATDVNDAGDEIERSHDLVANQRCANFRENEMPVSVLIPLFKAAGASLTRQ